MLILIAEEAPPSEYEEHFDRVLVTEDRPPPSDDWVFILKRGEGISPGLLVNVRAIVHNREGRGYSEILIPVRKGDKKGEPRLLRDHEGKTSKWITSCKSRRKRYYIL